LTSGLIKHKGKAFSKTHTLCYRHKIKHVHGKEMLPIPVISYMKRVLCKTIAQKNQAGSGTTTVFLKV
jgi:hypothetical protein